MYTPSMNEYIKIGYFVKKNFINNELLKKTLSEIELIKHNKDVDLYHDQKGLLRRVERIYDKGESLKKIDKKAKDLLREVFGFDFVIFKDKFNSKSQGGEGYYAHYDGIFKFADHQNKIKNGWYEYGQTFVNLLISLDTIDDSNGALEIGNVQDKTFDELFLDTKKDGTPNLLPEKEKKFDFKIINLNPGDALIFDHRCPHRSKKNNSLKSRKALYYTYSPSKFGSKYEKYFNDKKKSKNTTNKALTGDL